MKRIRSFGVFQTAKVAGIIYLLLGIVIVIPIWLIFTALGPLMRQGDTPFVPYFTGTLLIMLPIFYGIVGFLTTAIGCLIYNLIAGWTGGIELEVETIDPARS